MQIPGTIDYTNKLRDWDGFGINYVETCQTYDYQSYPQDYGGFSTLPIEKRDEIIELIFGDKGLKPSIVKMFLDPLHQDVEPGNIASSVDTAVIDKHLYDHESMTRNMRYFVSKGLEKTRSRGKDLSIYSVLYGPPRWMTKQKVWRGRDLDERYSYEICRYMASWVSYLKDQGFPIDFIGVHNEGEDFYRWDDAGFTREIEKGHDYNLYWSPEQVVKLLPILRAVLERNGLDDVYPTPGETTNWSRFAEWGYASGLCSNSAAMESIGLITSHGFYNGDLGTPYYGDHRSVGVDMLREKKPRLHAWSTSTSWSNMDARFLLELNNQIYSAKVNGIIPWACVQNHSLWADGDPNPGCAMTVDGKGDFEIAKGYWYYKQVCEIGQAGTSVVDSSIANSSMGILAFSGKDEDSFCLVNAGAESCEVRLRIHGMHEGRHPSVTRSTVSEQSKKINGIQIHHTENGDAEIQYVAPPDSATTFVFS